MNESQESNWMPSEWVVGFVYTGVNIDSPISVGERSKARVCGCLLGLRVRISPGTWMFVVSVVCCQVEVSATDRSHFQRRPADSEMTLCVI